MNVKLNRCDLDRMNILFRPVAQPEAARILGALLRCDYTWKDGDTRIVALDECVAQGISLRDGNFWFAEPVRREGSSYMTIDVFEPQFDERMFLSLGERILYDRFNAIAARVEELAKTVEDIRAGLRSAGDIDKQGLKK